MTKKPPAQEQVTFTHGYIVSVPPKTSNENRACLRRKGHKGSYHEFDTWAIGAAQYCASEALQACETVKGRSWKNHDNADPQAQRIVSILNPVAFEMEELQLIQAAAAARSDIQKEFRGGVPDYLSAAVSKLPELKVDFELAADDTYEAHIALDYACMTVDSKNGGECLRVLAHERAGGPHAQQNTWVFAKDYDPRLHAIARFEAKDIIGQALELTDIEEGELLAISRVFVALQRAVVSEEELVREVEAEQVMKLEDLQRQAFSKLDPKTVATLRLVDPNLPAL